MKKYDGVDDEIRKYWDKRIDAELKRRYKKNAVADDPKEIKIKKHLGEQNIGEVPYQVPWQYIVREQLGISMPIETPYKCPVCGYTYALDFPPEVCFYCGTKSFLHLPKIVNFSY